MSVSVASEWLNACSGCEISIVDMGERLLEVLEHIDFVHIPVLMDHKYYGQEGDRAELEIPKADIGVLSGSIRNEEHLEVAHAMREKCRLIVALGTCATHGGIPSLCNAWSSEELLEGVFSTETTDIPGEPPRDGVPALLDRCYALDEKIRVDAHLPGCAPHPDMVFGALMALALGESPELPGKSVCDVCPTVRQGKGALKKLRRLLQNPHYGAPEEPIDQMRCLLEQGFLCMGPVTRAGCNGSGSVPRCIAARVPCRGCFGPVKHDSNQLLDMLAALASNSIEIQSLPEHSSLLRFSGAHNLLRPRGHH